MQVKLSLTKMDLVCIHPVNDTYPIFTVTLDQLNVEYDSKFDHDEVGVQMKSLGITDHTEYPQTKDPRVVYKLSD